MILIGTDLTDCVNLLFVIFFGSVALLQFLPSVLWYCLLVGHLKECLVCKKLSDQVLAWLYVWSEVHMTYIFSSWCHCDPTISCFIKIQIGSTFLVPTYPGCPGKRQLNGCLSIALVMILYLFFVCRTNCTGKQSCWKICCWAVTLIWPACEGLSVPLMTWWSYCHRQWWMLFLSINRQEDTNITALLLITWNLLLSLFP